MLYMEPDKDLFDCRCLCVAEPVGFTLTEGEGEEPN